MKTITIHDAKTNLSKYIAAAKKGEHIYIGGFGRAEVVLAKIPSQEPHAGKRDFSSGKDKITYSADAFSASTEVQISDDMLNL